MSSSRVKGKGSRLRRLLGLFAWRQDPTHRLLEYVDLIRTAQDSLASSLLNLQEGDKEVANAYHKALMAYVGAAADLRIELIRDYSSGVFYGGIGDLLISLIETLNEVADALKRASRSLDSSARLPGFTLIFKEFHLRFTSLVDYSAKALSEIREAMQLLNTNRALALDRAMHANEIEETADHLKQALVEEFMLRPTEGSNALISSFRDLVLAVDDVIDRCGDASVQLAKIVSRAAQ